MTEHANRGSSEPGADPGDNRVDRGAMRASDAERDAVAAILSQGLSEGRLTTAEHADRLDSVYSARTQGELAPLTRDLPVSAATAPASTSLERREVVAAFSKVTRGGRWVAGRHTRLRAAFGALVVDLSEAVLPGREIELDVSAFCAKLIVRLPPGVQVVDDGAAIFSKRVVSARGDADDGPTGGGTDRPTDGLDEDHAGRGGRSSGTVLRIVGAARFSKVVIARGGDYPHWPWHQQWQHG